MRRSRPARGRIRRRFVWGYGAATALTITVTVLLGALATAIGNPWMDRVVGLVALVGVVTALILGILGAVKGDATTSVSPKGVYGARVRAGTNPLGVGYAFFLVLVCPVAVAMSLLLREWPGLQFVASMSLTVGLCVVLAASFRPLHVRADDASLRVERRFFWLELPWRRVASIELSRDAIRVRRIDGVTETFAVDAEHYGPVGAIVAELRARHAKALAGFGPAEGAEARWAVLDRNGRTVEAWRAELRALVRREEGYRAVTVTQDDLLRLLDDPETPAERRIAAALALGAPEDEGAKARVRVAVEATEERPLRAALDAALAERLDEAAVERASEAWREARAAAHRKG